MKHTSIKLDTPVEFINLKPLNPLISKCQIKVCYVGEEPNRNHSIITKETAREMANSLPGSPIVGFFNEATGDFEEHNRIIDISNGQFEIKDTTKPYGFVDLNAKCWFAKYTDDGVEHEYLMTEGYLWTGQYPECQRVIDQGNNQSMELDENSLDATWANDKNGKPQFFIINEAVISKLCILGENCEPCFEGSQITNVQFSFEDGFKQQLFSMMKELKDLLNEGEPKMEFTTYAVEIGDALWNSIYTYLDKNYSVVDADGWRHSKFGVFGIYEEGEQKFAILSDRQENKFYRLNFALSETEGFVPATELEEVTLTFSPANSQFAIEDVEAFEAEFFKKNEDKTSKEELAKTENKVEETKSSNLPEEKKEIKKYSVLQEDGAEPLQYDLIEELPEYAELMTKFSELEAKYNNLVTEKNDLEAKLVPLTEFKNAVELKEKQAMIDSFYMLTNEDKADVITNINNYSLDDIEAKLSIICVRNKVSFNLDEKEEKGVTTYNLEPNADEATPAWVKAAMDVAKTLK